MYQSEDAVRSRSQRSSAQKSGYKEKTMNEAIEKIKDFLGDRQVLYAATMGFDKTPNVHPVELCYEYEGALYFAVPKCGRFYGELSTYPIVKLCAYNAESGAVLTLSGKPVFTEDEAVIAKCIGSCRSIREAWGHDAKKLIAWFLTDAVCEIAGPKDGEMTVYELGTPENVLIGVGIKKDKELRDRLISIMEERESEKVNAEDETELYRQKLYDGAVLYFAETAKEIWPRMNILPIERSLLFETYDERERFVLRAKKLIGNAEINKPEDLTYWLNIETLTAIDSSEA